METIFDLSEQEFRKFTEQFKTAHFLQSYEWGEVSRLRGLKPVYAGVKKNNILVATALMLKKELPLGYSYYYIPRGYTIDYNDLDLMKYFTEEIKKYCLKHKAIFFRIDPDIKLHTIDDLAHKIEGEDNYKLVSFLTKIGFKHKKLTKYFGSMQPRYTFRIPLTNSIEQIESKYTKTTQQRIKKSENSGVIVEQGSEKDIDEFVRLMKITEKRQDFYSHSSDFYHKFYDIFSKNNFVTLYLGKIDIKKTTDALNLRKENLLNQLKSLEGETGKKANNRKKELNKEMESIDKQLAFFKDKPQTKITVSSYLTVNYGNKSWALYAANDMDYKNLFANYLVYKTQIRDAFNKHLDIFDVFGTIGDPTSKSNLVGLHDFKKKWGGEYTEFIGEFDYILNRPMYFMFMKVIPLRHKIIKKLLRRKNNK